MINTADNATLNTDTKIKLRMDVLLILLLVARTVVTPNQNSGSLWEAEIEIPSET